ncbi:proton-conducting transporter transmembrane domain-containing protein [Arthrobacter sp. H14]|uniref:proton-conducting transporter transmembrane domain-containing protein n=1 Tax=Arthrobacter sp. H14 TaxID=1312959 RepID=UPI000479CA8F|nr:proton-conducting transporter membrane subunit [Arthrobacter sp. H14]
MSGVLLWLLVGVPGVVGALLCMAGRRADRSAAAVSIGTAGLGVLLAVLVAVGRPSVMVPFMAGAPFSLSVDGLSAVVVPTVAVVTLLVLIFAAAEGTGPPARFHGLMLIFAGAVAVTATATSLPALLFAWEIMGAASYALIGFEWRKAAKVSGGLTAFLTTRVADLGLYAAAGAALAAGAGMDLAGLADVSGGWRHVIAAGILIAALGKAAQLPFSFWLSRAMEGPSPVSALLHSAAMVAMGGYLLLRAAPLLESTGWAGPLTAWIGVLTALVLGAVAVAQRDLKQLLAASTAAQLGFVVLAAGVGAIAGGTAHLVAHAATKALLFLAAGAWLTALGTKQLGALHGAARRWRVLGVAFAAGALALAGIPPLSLWLTKDSILASALDASPGLYAVGLVAAALSAAYAGKALIVLWQKNAPENNAAFDTEQQGTRHVGPWQNVPLVVLAIGSAGLGVLVIPPLITVLGNSLGGQNVHTPGAIELTVSAVIAIAVVILVSRFRLPEPAWALRWLGLEQLAARLIVAPTMFLARKLARFDDRVVDAAVTAGARKSLALAKLLARADDSLLDGAVDSSARAGLRTARISAAADRSLVDAAVESGAARVRKLGSLARLAQSGQVHHYYIQAVVILTAGAVLLIVVR